jgi:RNA-binding protein 25
LKNNFNFKFNFKGISSNKDQQQHHGVTIKTMTKKTIHPINQAFADEDDESKSTSKRSKLPSASELEAKRKEALAAQINAEERKRAIKKLVESIPTDKDELFNYPIDWSQMDQTLMEKRIKPWINKKIIEYIGEEEATLNNFICSEIEQRSKPDKLLDDVKVILDDEAELFVKKMWRLIVYETESKRCGLSK